MKIHQIFGLFNDGKRLQDIPKFVGQTSKTFDFCVKEGIDYKMWDLADCEKLIDKYPQYRELWDNFRHPIQRVDFARYLILYDEGGIYLDCDVCPIADIRELFSRKEFFVTWDWDTTKNVRFKELPYNAVMGSQCKNPLFIEIIQEVIRSVEEKNQIAIYERWIGRYVFQTTGHYAIRRVLKKHPQIPLLNIMKVIKRNKTIVGDNPMFEDLNANTW